MCGIAGKLHLGGQGPVLAADLERMMTAMCHRGPDGHGVFTADCVGLGHVRLAIIDLASGSQPMSNEDESVWIVFNGEIYNFGALRADLLARGHRFRTNSDTEIIVHLYEEYGRDCLQHLRGMFAFAIWDQRTRRLFLARDRVGIKPLYYYADARRFVFASELKALLTLPDVPQELEYEAVNIFWCFNYLPGEATMFRGIRKLLPGHWLEIQDDGRWIMRKYWDLQFPSSRRSVSLQEAADALATLLRETIRLHMVADVPVGFLLSGGIDSSAVLSFAAQETDKAINTFTIGFKGERIVDERPYARLMARRHGTHHYEATLSAQDFWNYLPRLLYHLEEPVCEPPAVALHYICEIARQHVKVLLSGEGGDEAFGGYPNYPNQLALQRVRSLLAPVRKWAGEFVQALGHWAGWQRLAHYGRLLHYELPDYYWSRVGSPFARTDEATGLAYLESFRSCLNDSDPGAYVRQLFAQVAGQPLLNQMLYIDFKTWLPDDLLIKADKVTMASSLELRVPLLDHVVLEFAATLPPELKVCGRQTKLVLKAAFARVIPSSILRRKKAGFPVPYGRWLANELWPCTCELLTAPQSFVRRIFTTGSIQRLLDQHRDTGSHQREVFSLLCLEFWYRQFQHSKKLSK